MSAIPLGSPLRSRGMRSTGWTIMANIAKLLSGIFVVLLLTYAAFYGRGMGERTINDLTARANQELVNHNLVGVTVAFEASPVRRVAPLRGNLPAAQRAQAIKIGRATGGERGWQ